MRCKVQRCTLDAVQDGYCEEHYFMKSEIVEVRCKECGKPVTYLNDREIEYLVDSDDIKYVRLNMYCSVCTMRNANNKAINDITIAGFRKRHIENEFVFILNLTRIINGIKELLKEYNLEEIDTKEMEKEYKEYEKNKGNIIVNELESKYIPIVNNIIEIAKNLSYKSLIEDGEIKF